MCTAKVGRNVTARVHLLNHSGFQFVFKARDARLPLVNSAKLNTGFSSTASAAEMLCRLYEAVAPGVSNAFTDGAVISSFWIQNALRPQVNSLRTMSECADLTP